MRALVLNLDYTPLGIQYGLRKIMKLSFKTDRITVVEWYDKIIESEGDMFQVPAVFHYRNYVKISPKSSPSRSSIYNRDGMTCQYCLTPLTNSTKTIDHVRPVSFFKKRSYANTWDNMVAACKTCNHTKADRTPEQAGMPLVSQPGKPVYFEHPDHAPKKWKKYLKELGQ